MAEALHLLHLERLWAKDGPLQASLGEMLAESDPAPRLRVVEKRQPPAAIRPALETAIERMIAFLDKLDGDPDFEPEPDELDADFERSVD